MLGWCWATWDGPGMGSELDGVEGAAVGDAGPDACDEDDDPGAFGGGLKKHVCSWDAHT